MSGTGFEDVELGVCAASGFRAGAVAAGIKRSGGLDLVLLVSDRPATVAGTFTNHRAAAAPVRISRARIAGGWGRGVVVNSGCANAVTGAQGMQDAEDMAAYAAAAAGVEPPDMLVCSTGKIGSHLPMGLVAAGVVQAAACLSDTREADEEVARAILTTDTRPKRAAVRHASGWSLGGMAKGAGMIAPNMATMLAFITTDAVVDRGLWTMALRSAVDASFNAITVDGEPSTNDTVLAFANGASGVAPGGAELASALGEVCGRLAEAIVADGEGATKLVRVTVTGAWNTDDARRAARSIADSPLVKCALYGADANWGRIAAAAGKAEVPIDIDSMCISMGGVLLYDAGRPAGDDAVERAHIALKEHEVEIRCDLGTGDGQATVLTTDLTPGYVAINAEYEP